MKIQQVLAWFLYERESKPELFSLFFFLNPRVIIRIASAHFYSSILINIHASASVTSSILVHY